MSRRKRTRAAVAGPPVTLNWTDPRKTLPAAYRAGKRVHDWLFGTNTASGGARIPGWVVLAGAVYVFRKPIRRKWHKWTH